MKLYTRETIIEGFAKYGKMRKLNAMNIVDKLTPIELPSDDDELFIPVPSSEKDGTFRDGAEIGVWMNGWKKGYQWVINHIKQQYNAN
jgi:hypothetical protein